MSNIRVPVFDPPGACFPSQRVVEHYVVRSMIVVNISSDTAFPALRFVDADFLNLVGNYRRSYTPLLQAVNEVCISSFPLPKLLSLPPNLMSTASLYSFKRPFSSMMLHFLCIIYQSHYKQVRHGGLT